LAFNYLPHLFTVNLIKNTELHKPVSAKLFLLRVTAWALLNSDIWNTKVNVWDGMEGSLVKLCVLDYPMGFANVPAIALANHRILISK